MTANLGSMVTGQVIRRITAPNGANSKLANLTSGSGLAFTPLENSQVNSRNIAADLVERSTTVKYPSVNVYCEKLVNNHSEKFRTFSGYAAMAVELRHSQDHVAGLQDALELYADSVMQTLDAAQGDWGDGLFYLGGYEMALSPIKQGGRSFIQSAKITFQIGVSRN